MTPAPESTDDRLVSLSKDGDLDAFNSLVDRYQDAVYNLCYRLLGNREAAADAAQEAFLSAYRAIHTFAGGNVRSWLLRIAANQSKDELRRRKRKDRAGSLDQYVDIAGAALEVADPTPGAPAVAEQRELSMLVQDALARLPFDQRQAIALVDLAGLRYEEAAEALGVSLGTVKSRIHRGRDRLRGYFRAHPELLAGHWRLDE